MRYLVLIVLLAQIPSIAQTAELAWVKKIGGAIGDDGNSIALDASGNVYSIGTFNQTVDFDPGPGVSNLTTTLPANFWTDIYVTKFDALGNFIWVRKLGGPRSEIPKGIAIDPSGNILVTGYYNDTFEFDPGTSADNLVSAGGTGPYDIFICKLANDGSYVWARRIGGTSNDASYAIATDASGNVYTTGYFIGTVDFDPGTGIMSKTSNGSTDIFVSKLDADGNFLLVQSIGGTTVENGSSIAVDASNNVFITGSFAGTVDFSMGGGSSILTSAGSYDNFICKLDNTGAFVWAKQMDGTTDGYPLSIVLDPSGNVITSGYFSGTVDFDPGAATYPLTSAGNDDIFVSSLDPVGDFKWAIRIGGTSIDQCKSIAVDASGNFYLTGYFVGTVDFDPGSPIVEMTSNGGSDAFICKLDNSGNFVWAEQMGGPTSDDGNGIALDASGNVYTTGSFESTSDFGPGTCSFSLTSAGQSDIFLQKLSQSVIPAPTITNFSPNTGPGATPVTITGTNFSLLSEDNMVWFGDVPAIVSSSTSTSIATTVPTGTLNAPIKLSIFCNSVTSSSNFIPTGPCYLPESERNALTDLYNGTNGAGWTNSANWLSTDESTWYGVTVSGCRTAEINLSSNQLNGSLPASISNLRYLQILKMDGNPDLSGSLPSAIGNMPLLKEINVAQNAHNGTIPVSLANCTALESLDLSGNSFSGGIPVFLGTFPNIKNIDLAENSFGGAIPPELGNSTTLVNLSLSTNSFNGTIPAEIGNLTLLQTLDFSQNQLTGSIPIELGSLGSLTVLKLSSNNLTGSIPTEVGNLVALQNLDLSQNQLSGTVPSSLGNLTALTNLTLNDNGLSGDFPASVSGITTFITVNLAQNQLTSIPTIGSYDLYVENNNLAFGSLEPNLGVINFSYSPQGKLPPGGTVSFVDGGTLTIPFSTSGTGNSYQWFRGVVPIDGATSSTLTVPGASIGDIGLYYIQISSSIVPNLTLESKPYQAQVSTDQCSSSPVSAGDLDLTFDPLIDNPTSVTAIGVQSTGQIIASTGPTDINGASVDGTVRFNEDGTLDGSFASNNYYASPGQMIIQPDDKILLTYNYDNSCYSIFQILTRLNEDGSDDSGFSPGVNAEFIFGIGLQDNGNILISYTEEASPPYLSRLLPDGSFDGSFNAPEDLPANVIKVQSDGSVLVGGNFDGGIVRLDDTGALDPNFYGYANGPVADIAFQPDGKIIVVGSFDYFNDVPCMGIVRLESDGNLDNSFNPIGISDLPELNSYFTRVSLQSDGRMVLAGSFETINGSFKKNLVKLFPDGSLDCTLDPGTSTNIEIAQMALQADEKILIAGTFVSYDGTTRNGFARVNNATYSATITITQQPGGTYDRCENSTITFSTDAIGTSNITYRWQKFNSGTSQFENITDGLTYTGSTTKNLVITNIQLSEDGDYRCLIQGDFATPVYCDIATLVVRTLPPAPITTNGENCGPGQVVVSASGAVDGEFIWYYDAVSAEPIPDENNSSFTTPLISETTSYYVSIVNSFCETVRVEVIANIINTTPPSVTGANRCGNGSITLSAAGAIDGQYRWYTSASGNTLITGEQNSAYITPILSITTTYYVSVNITGTCESSRSPVTATINITPTPPMVNSASTCMGSQATITASGGTDGQYRWYSGPTGSTLATTSTGNTFTTPSLSEPATYYVAIYDGICESARTPVTVTITGICNDPPVISTTNITVSIQGSTTIDLLPLLSDPNNDLDFQSLSVAVQPTSGALATISGTNLFLDYANVNFSGTDFFTLSICDFNAACAEQQLSVEVIGDVTVFNALSPGDDGKNDIFYIQYIDILESTKNNTVTIFNRWGDVVWETENYDNATRVFRGLNKNGNELPSGIYFYKVTFIGGSKPIEGFISLKR